MSDVVLENQAFCLRFDCESGALIGLTASATGWEILDRPHLGLSFRLLVPLSEERRNNPVFGEKQRLASLAVSDDRRAAKFVWDGVTSEHGGRLPIRLSLEVRLTDRQVIYGMTVENGSPYTVENVYCPYLGDIQHPQDETWFKTFLCGYADPRQWSLWPVYQNLCGYYGVDFPTQIAAAAPMAPFILLRGARQGLYVGLCAPSTELVAWHTELRPGYGSSIDFRVPEGRTINGQDVATRFAAVHVPYIQAGETRALTPIALEAFQGSWHKGADIYKAWRDSWMRLPCVPGWARDPHAWQQVHINSPEDELRVPFRDLPKIGKVCADHDVRAIQLVGWNDGGQDQGNPSHDPDPRLGTFQELKDAIARIHAMGVQVILFSKFTWADRASERFRKNLVGLAAKDPHGDYYHYSGYQYQTATQLLDINTTRLIPMCFQSGEYLRCCEQEFQKVLALGAAGILFDECQHHSPALLCFDTSHGHRYGAPVYANDRQLILDFSRLSQPVNPGFLYAGEACYDWEMEAYHLLYYRTENKGHIPVVRYLLPHTNIMTAVTGFHDRNMINQCLLYRYIVSYEPYNFKGRLDDLPLTVEYGRKMDELRTALREYFWDGEFLDTQGALVTCSGQPHHPYSVYVNRSNGAYGVAVANYDEDDEITLEVALDDGGGLGRYRLVDDPAWHVVKDGVRLPPCSAAVVVR